MYTGQNPGFGTCTCAKTKEFIQWALFLRVLKNDWGNNYFPKHLGTGFSIPFRGKLQKFLRYHTKETRSEKRLSLPTLHYINL